MNTTRLWLLGAALAAGATGALLLRRAAGVRRLRYDAQQLFAAADTTQRVYHEAQLVSLPAPVQSYFRQALHNGQPYLRGLRLRHSGQFKTSLEKPWMPITGEEYLRASPPGLIWQGSTRLFTARDEYGAGCGRLTVQLLGAVPLLRGAGPNYDQGELLRWLTEAVLLPTRLLPGNGISWTALDHTSAQLHYTHQGQSAACVVRFNAQHEIAQCEALRYQGEAGLQPWVGRFGHYRDWHGVRVPTVLEACWVQDGQCRSYAQFVVQELEYEPLAPF